jgi:eukaryotic-like serine/threonine-protein kinase
MSRPQKRDTDEAALFSEALEKPRHERPAFLAAACGSDLQLRERLEALLAAHDHPAGLLATRAEMAPTITIQVADEGLENDGAGRTIGRYKLLEKLGEGGCGVVYVAEQTEPVRRRVALKVIKLGMDTKQVVARFEAERQALALMDHPNIAKVLDAGTTESGRPYFVMELVRGIRITDYCDQEKLPIQERLNLLIKVCHAIQHAHQKGIIHRDIKPSNILVTLHDGVPVPKVIDFGIAKATEGRLTEGTVYTQLHQFIGTPAYMSPEQAEMSGLDIDTRADIYSLGVLLYELLTGTTPFDGKELMASGIEEMRKTIRDKEPPRPSTRLTQRLQGVAVRKLSSTAFRSSEAAIPSDLDWVVMKCLEKDRSRRYETANGLAADLKRHLNNEPVVARPPTAVYRFHKAFRRNKVAFAAMIGITTALLAGTTISTWQMFAARNAQREADLARQGERQQLVQAQGAQKVAESERERADAQAARAAASREHSRHLLYASDINLAQQYLKVNNIGKVRRLLNRHLPQPGEADLRGWEWRYLWQQTRSSALVTLTNRPSTRGFSASFSPDGTRLAVGWYDGRTELWDVPGRRLIRALTNREYNHTGQVSFSPVENLLAATSSPGVVALYDLASGLESVLWQAPEDGVWDVRDIAFSEDGSRVTIYAGSTPEIGDGVWVVNVSSSKIETREQTAGTMTRFHGSARLSPDNQRLYLARSDAERRRYTLNCIDLKTGQVLWQSEPQSGSGVTALAVSPDGRVLATASAFEDPSIRIWDSATGKPLVRLDGHTGWVSKLVFGWAGRRLISAASDQTIRLWDANTWTESQVLRGHFNEIHALSISETAQLIASASKDGDLMLWNASAESEVQMYRRLLETQDLTQLLPLDRSRVMLLPPGKAPRLLDLKDESRSESLHGIKASNILGWFGTNVLCRWDETNQILLEELRETEFMRLGSVLLETRARPVAAAYNPARQLMAWSEGANSTAVLVVSLNSPENRVYLTNDVPGLVHLRLTEDGNYLAAATALGTSLRAWNIKTGQIVVSLQETVADAVFAAGGRVLVAAIIMGDDHAIGFFDLDHPEREPRRVAGRYNPGGLAVSPDGRLVAASTHAGHVRLFNPVNGELIDFLDAHINAVRSVAFSPDGRRLISAFGGRDAIMIWDVATRQELITLEGIGSFFTISKWTADGDTILAGAPWQAWRAPSWEEIETAGAKEKTDERRRLLEVGPK